MNLNSFSPHPTSKGLMSPTPKDDVPLPARKASSSALFSAFRTLTGRRSTNTASPPPIIAASGTPAVLTPSEPVPSPLETKIEPSRNGEIGTFHQGTDGIVQQHGKVLAKTSARASELIGGPPELANLLVQLNSSHSTSERLSAIDKICNILPKYKISNVLLLWSAASDLLELDNNTEATRAAYKLLQTCVKVPELSSLERSIFFKAISRNGVSSHFDLRFQALLDLTHGGRNVDSFEASVAQFLGFSLTDCFSRGRESRRAQRRSKNGSHLKTEGKAEDELDRMFQFVIDVVKFNSKIFHERDIANLLHQIVSICRETARSLDVEKSIILFDILVTYTQIPDESLRPCLELFCDVYRQLKPVQDLTWRALSNLLRSHAGPTAVSTLLGILHDPRIGQGEKKNVSRGAIRVIQRLAISNGTDGLPRLSFGEVLPALKASLLLEHRKLELDILELVAIVLTDGSLTDQLLGEDDWSDFVELMLLCSRGHAITLSNVSDTASEPRSHSVGAVSETSALPDPLMDIFGYLRKLHIRADFVQRDAIFDLFLRSSTILDAPSAEFLVQQYAVERLLHPSNAHWELASRELLKNIFQEPTRPRQLRIEVLKLLVNTFHTINGVYADSVVESFAKLVLDNIPEERDAAVLDFLADFAVLVNEDSDITLFNYVMDHFKTALSQTSNSAFQPVWNVTNNAPGNERVRGSTANVIALAITRMFIEHLNTSFERVRNLFDLVVHIAGNTQHPTDARLTALKLLFRLRSDSQYSVFISPNAEGQTMARVLCRTIDTALDHEEPARLEDDYAPTPQRLNSSPSPHSSLTRQTSRQNNIAGRFPKHSSPLWMYPGPQALPVDPSQSAGTAVFSHLDPEKFSSDMRGVLKIALWLELLISIMQQPDDWEVYSYVLAHLGAQLANQSLFKGCVPQIKLMRNVLCEQIRANSFHEPPSHTSLKKADVAICLYYSLTILVSYHRHFEKSEEDEIVRIFFLGIGSSDRTSKWCIHAITICCHELPLSTSKSLDNIIQKMSQVVTQQQLAVHILEFLTALSRMPELYKNFREEQFKMVFGVSLQYLQYVRYQKEKLANSINTRNSNPGYGSLRHSGPSREFPVAPESDRKRKEHQIVDDLPQYVYALAYHVIIFWFIAMKLQDRRNHMAWITKSLISTDSGGKEVVEEQGQVTIDLMQRVAFSDRDETRPDPQFAGEEDGEVSKKTWVIGHSLVTIETAARTGASQITTRRASGTRYLTMRPNLTMPPRHQVPIHTGLAAEAFYTTSYIGILPDDILQTIVSPFSFPAPEIVHREPIVLPEDDATRRAITAFDRNPTVDGHKIGVIYVGHGQTSEHEILSNAMGSPDYTQFIDDLGTLTRLKDAAFNPAGLDIRMDSDGEFTYCWRDRLTEIVFHIATLMPTDPANPETILRKKSHIGNDFVTVVFNNSGLPYKFDTVKSQFNYVVIVITPEAPASFMNTRIDANTDNMTRFYKVQVLSRADFPETSPAAETKVVSLKHLASCVRLIALNASYFSLVWAVREGGESISPWRNRLREIKKLREKNKVTDAARTMTPPPGNSTHTGSSAFSSTHPRDSALSFIKRTSIATPTESGPHRSSFLIGGADMERQGSDSTR